MSWAAIWVKCGISPLKNITKSVWCHLLLRHFFLSTSPVSTQVYERTHVPYARSKERQLSLFIMDIDIIKTSQLKFKSTGDAGARSARARC